MHSSTSWQTTPLAGEPGLVAHPSVQLQVNDPSVLLHVASGEQLSVPRIHSFTSLQTAPEPVHPALHRQVKEPSVSAHVASGAHVSVPRLHSSTLAQIKPFPEYPLRHSQL